ncbi:hypothetical protein ACIGEP_11585 [Microbacterium sp. NPDC077663]|uniref:hypothetical protein n=1 Tax=Microbacterium sp. NPDC077663 TaxID=3364189 RepID=UPI0037C69433
MSRSPSARDEVPEGIPTALDWVVMCADMATVHAAQRYACIVELWDDAIADARRREEPVAFVERSVRLEVASALRITEHAAGRLMGVGRSAAGITPSNTTDWRVKAKPGGALEWTSPAGRVYLVHPERRIPQFTVDPPGAPPF